MIYKFKAPYNVTVSYNANGGQYSENENINKMIYTISNNGETIVHSDGEYVEPTREGHVFEGWYTDIECTDGNEFIAETPQDNNLMVYAKWRMLPKYAVAIYGIGVDDVSEDGSVTVTKGSMTFGPATGGNYVTTEKPSHIALENETASDMCIHNHTWEEIIAQKNIDPHTFDNCISNYCTKSVELDIPAELKGTISQVNIAKETGDGPSMLYYELAENARRWNAWGSSYGGTGSLSRYNNIDGWGVTGIRAVLNGVDDDNSDGIITHDDVFARTQNLISSNALVSAFPSELRDEIVPRKVLYDSVYNSKTTANLKTTYDMLWLLSPNEMSLDSDAYSYCQHPLEADDIYDRFNNQTLLTSSSSSTFYIAYYNSNGSGSPNYWSLRSSSGNRSDDALYIHPNGALLGNYTYFNYGVAPCFTLR